MALKQPPRSSPYLLMMMMTMKKIGLSLGQSTLMKPRNTWTRWMRFLTTWLTCSTQTKLKNHIYSTHLSMGQPNHQSSTSPFIFCPWDNQNRSFIIINSHNAFITSSAQKFSQGTALSFHPSHHSPLHQFQYRWYRVGLFSWLHPSNHPQLPSPLPNHVVVTPVVATT